MKPTPSRFEVLPLPDHRVSLRIDGDERVGWNFGPNYPRPFFFPLLGPSGQPLTRMGHPGAPNHDHHQSVWFAHHKVLGIDFWGNTSTAQIRQKQWLAYQENEDAGIMAVQLAWYDGHDPRELLDQDVIAILRQNEKKETLLEIQTVFKPTSDMLEFGKTNFGFLAVRVAKSLSEHFGGGTLTNSHGATGEPAIFGKTASWMDYSGPVVVRKSGTASEVTEGITYFDHPSNPRFPSAWHVRADGWMGAAVCLNESIVTTKQEPLRLRYLLHVHSGPCDMEKLSSIAREFHSWPSYSVMRSKTPHVMFEVGPG